MTQISSAPIAALGFADLRDEHVIDDVETQGDIPLWLRGTLLRTGPARWDLPGGTVNHWFDGLAMLHRFAIRGGRISYANRRLNGRAALAVERTGRLGLREFATDPPQGPLRRLAGIVRPQMTDNGAGNVDQLGDRWFAITEGPMAVEFDPRTLTTLTSHARAPRGTLAVAHPQQGAEGVVCVHTRIGPRCHVEIVVTDVAGGERVLARTRVGRPAYQHSFALADEHIVLTVPPLRLRAWGLVTGARPYIDNFGWEPERLTRLVVHHRRTGAQAGRWFAPAVVALHHVNAFAEPDGAIVVDLLGYDDPAIFDALRISRLRAGEPVPSPRLLRHRLRPGRVHAEVEELLPERFELPATHPRVAGRPHRFVWGVAPRDGCPFGAIVKADVAARATVRWEEPDLAPGEPVFVPRPDGTAEDDGVLLVVALDARRGASSLVVLDAADLRELGRALLPHHVPFGLHGKFAPRMA